MTCRKRTTLDDAVAPTAAVSLSYPVYRKLFHTGGEDQDECMIGAVLKQKEIPATTVRVGRPGLRSAVRESARPHGRRWALVKSCA